MKKRIFLCLLCQILLFTNIFPSLTFKAYADDEAISSYQNDKDETGSVLSIPEVVDEVYTTSVITGIQNDENEAASDSDGFHYSEHPEEPDDILITEEEYLASLEKDKNNNGILDILEDEEEIEAAAMETGILGDLNGDELVDNKDVILFYRWLDGWEQDINDKILDFNGDGYTNNSDAAHLMKYVSGWSDITLYKGKKYDIIYHLYSEETYLKQIEITNPNPDYYYTSEGLTLRNITADGYTFEGWYDGEGESAERIKKIEVGETGEIELYARWTPKTYRIDFDSELVEVLPKYYTIETGATLSNPSLSNYIFVGWTHQETGKFIRNIPKGSFGNVTLVANWASRRNLARPVQQLGDPVIIEDENAGKILFLYELGTIENIPLFTLYRFSTAEGMSTSVTLTEQTSISTSDAKTISEAVANATTDSATWTLSEGWNDTTSISEESLRQTGRTREEAETIAKSSTDTYRLDTTVGESSVTVDSSQFAFKGSLGLGSSSGHTTESGQNFGLSVDAKNETTSTLGATVGLDKIASVNASVSDKFSLGIGAEYGNYVKHTDTTTDSWNIALERAGQSAHSDTTTKNWNLNSSYSNSNSVSNSRSVSEQLSELISDKYGYGRSYSKNGEHSSGQAFTTQMSNENKYSNTVTYDQSTLYSKEVTYSTDGKIDGYYRQVLAGTAHVFAVVGYDVATSSYFTYTYTVMDDETYEFLDYSKSTPNFDDNEISVLPFEIPYFVNEYVNAKIARSKGLVINIETGMVTGYTGEDPFVVVPSYVDINNGDGTYASIKVTGFTADAFKNNTKLEGIMFGEFVSEIPDSAFEGCTSLQNISFMNLTSIGNRAFYGCTSLSTLTIPDTVTHLGDNVFYNVNEVKITASNKNVALAAVNSGVQNLILNISSINEEMADTELEISSNMNAFELQGGRKPYSKLIVRSQADTTRINGISFVDCTKVPLELSSSVVELYQTSVSGTGYCLLISSNDCEVNLFGTNELNTSGANAMVCGNVTLGSIDPGVQGMLKVSGNVYVCGGFTNAEKYLTVTNGSIIPISPEEFANLEELVKVLPKTVSISGAGTVDEGKTIALTATISPVEAVDKTVTWSSDNPAVATVSAEGVVTGLKAGTANITATANGDTAVKATVTVTVRHPYVLHFNANEPEAGLTPSISATEKSAFSGYELGTLPTVSCDYYDFIGWYTAATGGERQTEHSVLTTTESSLTLYAHWRVHDKSGWVLSSAVPQGARITDTSYSYRESTESTSSSKSGWTNNGSYVRETGRGSKEYAYFPGTFDTGHWVYSNLSKEPYAASGNNDTWREVSNTHSGYVYWHWAYNVGYSNNTDRWISDRNQTAGASRNLSNWPYCYFYAFKSTTDAPTIGGFTYTWSTNARYDSGMTTYNCANCLPGDADTSPTSGLATPRFLRFDYYTSTYVDYQRIYMYYRDLNYQPTKPSGSNISNLKTYVKYQAK